MIKTAEAVSPAHPDKLADQISDLILTEALKQDPFTRAGIEVLGGHGVIHVVGEMTTHADVDIEKCMRAVLSDNRYNPEDYELTSKIVMQSQDIARGVDVGGAGDQGIMVGYACKDNELFIPQELHLSREILKALWSTNMKTRDAKSQVTIRDGKVAKVVVSAERLADADIIPVIGKVLGAGDYELIINPAGDWDNGGFNADTGLTGRKIAYDNYGPQIEIGGGCFSGKDPTKVDRSAAYFARKMAKHVLKKELERNVAPIDWVKFKVAYAIGVASPVMVSVQCGNYDETDVTSPIDVTAEYSDVFKPANIIETLKLRGIDYYQVAKWGSFGNDFSWEN